MADLQQPASYWPEHPSTVVSIQQYNSERSTDEIYTELVPMADLQ